LAILTAWKNAHFDLTLPEQPDHLYTIDIKDISLVNQNRQKAVIPAGLSSIGSSAVRMERSRIYISPIISLLLFP